MAFIRLLYDLYTAIARPLCLSGKIIVPPSSSMQSKYGHYTAIIRPLYQLRGGFTTEILENTISR